MAIDQDSLPDQAVFPVRGKSEEGRNLTFAICQEIASLDFPLFYRARSGRSEYASVQCSLNCTKKRMGDSTEQENSLSRHVPQVQNAAKSPKC
jgi:hypothetical protein